MISKDIGIVIFGYNRPSHFMRVLIALEDYQNLDFERVYANGT